MIFSLGNGNISHEESSGEGAPENLAANPRPARGRGVRPRGKGPRGLQARRVGPFYVLTNSRSGLSLHHSLINGDILKGLMQALQRSLKWSRKVLTFLSLSFPSSALGSTTCNMAIRALSRSRDMVDLAQSPVLRARLR